MIELVRAGYENIVCAQPFGCLPNHICGKGMINKIRELYPQANITPIDYDPSATRVNQENRIKLMLAVARERLAEKTADQSARETPAPAETPQSGGASDSLRINKAITGSAGAADPRGSAALLFSGRAPSICALRPAARSGKIGRDDTRILVTII